MSQVTRAAVVPSAPPTDFYRAFSARVRETVAEHARTADLTETRPSPTTSPAPATSVPRSYDNAAKIAAPGARGALLAAYLFTPNDEPEPPTCLTVYSEPNHDADMNVGQALEFRAQIAAFLPRLDAMIAAMPQPEPAAPAPSGKTWTITTDTGVKVSGYLPAWDLKDPSEESVPAARLGLHLADLAHVRYFDGQTVNVDVGLGAGEGRYVGPSDILAGGIWLTPHSEDSVDRVPTVHMEVLEGSDDWLTPLDPDGLTDLASKLRAQADRLEFEVRPQLIAARADWAQNGGTR